MKSRNCSSQSSPRNTHGRSSSAFAKPPSGNSSISKPVALFQQTNRTSRESTDHAEEENHKSPQGRRFDLTDADRADIIELTFDYRGDVTLTLDDDSTTSGYLFDRRHDAATGTTSIRLIEQSSGRRITFPIDRITAIEFTGRDTAAGKSWDTWIRRYTERMRAK